MSEVRHEDEMRCEEREGLLGRRMRGGGTGDRRDGCEVRKRDEIGRNKRREKRRAKGV